MPEEDVSKFFAGVPPLPQQEEEGEGEGGEKGEEREKGEEGGRLHPPKAKRSKSEEKALNVASQASLNCFLCFWRRQSRRSSEYQ